MHPPVVESPERSENEKNPTTGKVHLPLSFIFQSNAVERKNREYDRRGRLLKVFIENHVGRCESKKFNFHSEADELFSSPLAI